MRFPIILILLIALATGGYAPCAYAQKDQIQVDSIDAEMAGKTAKANVLFFDALKAKQRDDPKQAKQLFQEFATLMPESAVAHYELAKIANREKKLEEAIRLIKKAISLDNGNKWYKEEHASILAEMGNYAEAAQIVEELCKTDPTDRTYPLMAYEYLRQSQKFPEAMVYLDKVIARSSQDDDLMMRKMHLYMDMNEVQKAAGVLQLMINKDQQNGKLYKMLADLYDDNKMPDKADGVYKEALKNAPTDPAVQLGLAQHYLKAGDTASYMAYVKKAIVNADIDAETQLYMFSMYMQSLPTDSVRAKQGYPLIQAIAAQHPADPDALELYAGFLELSNLHDSAMILYKKALALKPANFGGWRKLLSGYTNPAEADSLIKYSEKAMRLFPTQVLAHYYNSIGHYNKKAYPAAIKAVKRAIDLQPETEKNMLASLYAFLGDLYHSNAQDNLSDEAFEQALSLDSTDATVLNNYAYYLSERGKKLELAERMSAKSLVLRPGEATFLDTYGWICYQRGDYAKAKSYLQQALDKASNTADATLHDHMGNALYKLNDKENAIKHWKMAKEKGGSSPILDKKISEGKLYE